MIFQSARSRAVADAPDRMAERPGSTVWYTSMAHPLAGNGLSSMRSAASRKNAATVPAAPYSPGERAARSMLSWPPKRYAYMTPIR